MKLALMSCIRVFAVVLLVALEMLACNGDLDATRTYCASSEECLDSPEVLQAGRCAPMNVYCKNHGCVAHCAEECSTVLASINPCRDQSLICTDSANLDPNSEIAYCTGRAISCDSVGDCPRYRPFSDGDWSCEEDVCRFPGFKYADE